MTKKNILWLLLAVLLVALLVIAAIVYNGLKDGDKPDNLADAQTETDDGSDKVKAPDFTMLDYDGNEVKLSELFGKPIVLNMWASWCPPCKAELPDFENSFKERGDIQFVMLNMTGNGETLATAKQYIDSEGFTFPVYFDTAQEASYLYGATSIPMTFFIDKDGNVVTHAVGMIDAATLARGIDMID